jgi:hypothetical protein
LLYMAVRPRHLLLSGSAVNLAVSDLSCVAVEGAAGKVSADVAVVILVGGSLARMLTGGP